MYFCDNEEMGWDFKPLIRKCSHYVVLTNEIAAVNMEFGYFL